MRIHRILFPILTMLGACGGGGDGRIPVVVYSPHGPDILKEFEQKFESAHPQADVQTFNMSTGDILTRVRSEAGSPRCDVWWGAPSSTFSRAAEDGLFEPYRPTWAEQVDARYLDPEDRYAGHFLIPQVIIYNREKLAKEEAPADWDDLLDESFRDRIILRFPMPSGSMRGSFSWLIAWKSQNGADLERGFSFLEQLHDNTKKYSTNPNEFFEAIKRDPDRVVGIWNLTDALFQREEKGYPFGVVIPRAGVPVVTDCIALIKKSGPNPERAALARRFYEFVTSLEAAESLMNTHSRILTRNDIPEEDLPAWRQEYPFEPLPVDPAFAAKHEDEWMKRWDREIKTRSR